MDAKDSSAVTAAPAGVLEAIGERVATAADVLSLVGALCIFVGLLAFKSVGMVCAAIVVCAASSAMGAALIPPRQWLLAALFSAFGLFQLQYLHDSAALAAAAAAGAPPAASA